MCCLCSSYGDTYTLLLSQWHFLLLQVMLGCVFAPQWCLFLKLSEAHVGLSLLQNFQQRISWLWHR